MSQIVEKKQQNGFGQLNPKLLTKNRLRIHGKAILEREDHPNITAAYEYTTSFADDFFEEDVDQLHCFELNKIALGMTIYKKEDIAANGYHKNGSNGLKNGSFTSSPKAVQAMEKYQCDDVIPEPFLTDVIWSRMHMTKPNNPNAYVIKQYYDPKSLDESIPPHGDRCNNFLCGFLTCCIMMVIGYGITLYPYI